MRGLDVVRWRPALAADAVEQTLHVLRSLPEGGGVDDGTDDIVVLIVLRCCDHEDDGDERQPRRTRR